jgi:hypothetical protein
MVSFESMGLTGKLLGLEVGAPGDRQEPGPLGKDTQAEICGAPTVCRALLKALGMTHS